VSVTRVDEFTHPDSTVKPSDLVMLWSGSDRDWQAKLAAIPVDSDAGRASRNHIFPLKRLKDDLASMNEVVEMVECQRLTLARIPADSIDCQLNAYHARKLAVWGCLRGKQMNATLRYAMWWFQQHRQHCDVPDHECVAWSKSRTHRAHLGRPAIAWMVAEFKRRPNLKRQCLIPYFKRQGPNELLVFQRGPEWNSSASPSD
jgi:hypothetical protein